MYKNAWLYIGSGFFLILTAINLVQYYEPAASFVALLVAGGSALIIEGIDRRKRWLATTKEARRRFSY